MAEFPGPLVDVLSDVSYGREHLPGAVNFCVYETAFVEKMLAAFPDKEVALTVYGCGDSTREAEVAVARLKAAGYTKVMALAGGLEGWKAAGGELEVGPAAAVADGWQAVDREGSFVHWTGRNLFNYHTGGLKLGDGRVLVEGGRLKEGVLTVDMTSLSCADLTDSALNAMLVAHLKSGDFFEVGEHPLAEFRVRSAEEIPGATAGVPNHRIEGDFTLRGVTRPLSFDALVARKEDGGHVAQAVFEVDRTLWGSIYGSGKFFARLGQHVVNDAFHVRLKVATGPE